MLIASATTTATHASALRTLSQSGASRVGTGFYSVAAKELKLSYHNPETILFTMYPYYGNLN